MSSTSTNSVISDVKAAAKGVHGAGEAIRGTINRSVNEAFNDPAGQAKEQAVADKGMQEINQADAKLGSKQGVENSQLKTGGVSGPTTTSATTGATTGAGAHSGAAGNMRSNPVPLENLQDEPGITQERY